MSENLVRGTITNLDTGERSSVEHYLIATGSELTGIVRVLEVNSYVHPEDDSMQILVSSQALDSVGGVYDLVINFLPESVTERDQILGDLKVDSILLMKGEYLIPRDGSIMLGNPVYRPVDPVMGSEDQMREAFRINSETK